MTYVKGLLLYALFASIIMASWRFYELKRFGEVMPDPFHSVIAVILTLSLMLNVILYRILTKGYF